MAKLILDPPIDGFEKVVEYRRPEKDEYYFRDINDINIDQSNIDWENFEAFILTPTRPRPKAGNKYYYITEIFEVNWEFWGGTEWDMLLFQTFNCFLKKSDAHAARKELVNNLKSIQDKIRGRKK